MLVLNSFCNLQKSRFALLQGYQGKIFNIEIENIHSKIE
jgi:hypothetical protein